MASEIHTFDAEDFAELRHAAATAVAARAIQRCMPLYHRSRKSSAHFQSEITLLDEAVLWARTYCTQGVWRGGFVRAHDLIGRFALSLMRDNFDDPATSIALACSELCLALSLWSEGRQHSVHNVPNNTLRAASLTKPGLDTVLLAEINTDIHLYQDVAGRIIVPFLDKNYPLWSSTIPDWFLDPESESLLHSFEIDREFDQKTIIEITQFVSDELLHALAQKPKLLYLVHHRAFEELIADIWERFGFNVELMQTTRDRGRDIIAIRNKITPVKYLIECKRLREGARVDIQAVRALWYVKSRDKATKAILATTGRFGKDTLTEFEDRVWELELRDFNGIIEWLNLCTRRDV